MGETTGKHLLEGYGLTECAPLVAGNPYDLKHYSGSIGLPVPSTDIRLLDDNGRMCRRENRANCGSKARKLC